MGWEARGESARKYYTRSRKRFRRVEREYVGCGPAAIMEANLDDLRRQELAEAKRVKRKARVVHRRSISCGAVATSCNYKHGT
jgi:hypothetical protein